MSENFDPYYKWLGIAPYEQPPNNYRLLGLNLFESDLDVIANAADRQMRHLRSFQTGPRMPQCQQLLNEVAGARVVLLNDEKKTAYDQQLRASLAPVAAPPPVNTVAVNPVPVNTVPLTPADTLPPRGIESAAPKKASSISSSAATASPVTVVKGTRRPRSQSMSYGILIAGGVIGLAAVLAIGFGLSVAFRPRPVDQQAARPAEVAPPRREETVEPVLPAKPLPSEPVAPIVDPPIPSQPANALGDVLEEYDCTSTSQPRLAIDSSFDATKSWRLSFSVNASAHPAGAIFCWGDNRAGMDPICIRAGPDFVDGSLRDNNSSDGATALPEMSIGWTSWHEIELVHDAVAKVVQLRVDDERQSISVTNPPRPDRDMPVHLGGIGAGALHAFPCRLREVRLEQLTDPVNLPSPSAPAVEPAPQLAANVEPTEMPAPTGTLGDLVKPTAANKPNVPPETELQAAREQLQRFFANDLNKERTPQEAATFADRLVDQAIQSGTQTATRYALLEMAVDIAAKGGAVASASRAFEELDRAFAVDLAQMKAEAALKIARLAKEASEHKAVAELLEVVIDECLANDRYDLATSLADAAIDAARKAKDSSTTTRIAARSRDVKSLNAKYEPVRAALEALAAGSDDPAANDTVGRHLCLVKGKWQEGLPYLVKSGTSDLRDIAARDIRNPSDPDIQTTLGSDWRNVAVQLDKRLQLHALSRAEHWYRLALAQASGLKKLPLESQINELSEKIGQVAELPPGAVLVMTFEPSTLKRQGYVLDVSQHGYIGVVKGAVLADGIAGKALAFDGKDDYVEVASAPWLSAPSACTLAAWVNVVAWQNPNDAKDYVISKDDGKSGRAHGYVLRYRVSGFLNLTLASSGWRDVLSTTKASLGEWHHAAATYDGNICKVFMDGAQDGNELAIGVIDPSDVPLRIGQAAHYSDRGIRGRIDEVAIFNRALSAEEMRTVYRIGRAGRPLME